MDCKKVRSLIVSAEILAGQAKRCLDNGDTKSVDIMIDGIEQDIKNIREEMKDHVRN